MLKKLGISCLIFIFMLGGIYATISSAAFVPVTDENLKKAFEELNGMENNGNQYQFSVADNKITVTSGQEKYIVNYDLTGKPTFSSEVTITKDMTEEQFQEEVGPIAMPMMGYLAVCNVQGVTQEDASAYFIMNVVMSLLGTFGDSGYEVEDGANFDALEYVAKLFEKKVSITDATDYGTYEYSIERTDIQEDSCKLISKLAVNTTADFSQLKGYSTKNPFESGDTTPDTNEVKNNTTTNNTVTNNEIKNNTITNNEIRNNTITNNTTINRINNQANNTSGTKKTLPYAGWNNVFVLGILIIAIITIVTKIKNEQYKDIK